MDAGSRDFFRDPEFGRALAVEEFKSLRSESAAAKSNQQSILQWSLAAAGVVLAGAIAATRPVADVDPSSSNTAVVIAFATILPLLAGGAFGVWIGEVERMERVGRFLRERERATWAPGGVKLEDEQSFHSLPIMWESLIFAQAPRLQSSYGKNRFGSGAAAAIFLGIFLLSFGASVTLTWAAPTSLPFKPLSQWVLTTWSVAVAGAGTTIFAHRLRKIAQRSRGEAEHDSELREAPDQQPFEVDVVLPCFNEVDAIRWVLAKLPDGFRAIVVDNGSTDGSPDVARKLGAEVLSSPQPGPGAASSVGVLAAKTEVVCVMDCDGTVDPEGLPRLIRPILDSSADLVIGTRDFQKDSISHFRKWMFLAVGLLIRRRMKLELTDLGSARAIRRASFKNDMAQLDRRYGWSLDLLRVAVSKHARVEQVPLEYLPRIGKSKITGTLRGASATLVDTIRVLSKSGDVAEQWDRN